MKIDVSGYLALIHRFISGEISALDFEQNYLRLFKADVRPLQGEVYEVLNKLFSDVDVFCADSSLRRHDDLDEEGLLECAKIAYNALTRIAAANGRD